MTTPLIYSQQNPFHRAFDIVVTFLAWVFLASLIVSGVHKLLTHETPQWMLEKVIFYLFIAIVVNVMLILWAKYNQFHFRIERRHRQPGLTRNEVAKSLHVLPDNIYIMAQARCMTVSHADNGRINAVKVTDQVS